MWRLLIGCLCVSHIVWAQRPPSRTSDETPIQGPTYPFWCPFRPTSCKDVGSQSARLVKIILSNMAEVLCDTQTDNGGWTIIQRRYDGSQSFYLGWGDYVNGFGNLDGNFWMGLRLMNEFTYKRCYELRIDMYYNETSYYAQYSYFKVYGPEDNYSLNIGTYSGNAGDALSNLNGLPFTTKDKDNDQLGGSNCAELFTGAWWYKDCHSSNLNGQWGSTEYGKGVVWHPVTTHYDSLALSEMKIRPCP